MGHRRPGILWLALLGVLSVLFSTSLVPPVSACSLNASLVPAWLQFVLSHGLATLNPDCTLTWKTGVVTDLNGNPLSPPALVFMQQYGAALFVVGVILAVIGTYLISKSKRRLPIQPVHELQSNTG
jgi:hypothetical protein